MKQVVAQMPTESRDASRSVFDHIVDPVLNTPYEPTARCWKIGEDNRAIAEVEHRRRPSIGILPVPKSRRDALSQQELQLTPEDFNATVNEIRSSVAKWRAVSYRGATSVSQHLLRHWADERNEPRLFFAQLEALETIIWFAEVARSDNRLRRTVEEASREHNDDIVRYATKMATGTGKTVVMGMVVAWQAVNAAALVARGGPGRRYWGRYCTSFVAITPGHTVRERLMVLDPSCPDNVYDEMGLVPAGMRAALGRVKLRVVNFQAFQRRDLLSALGATGDACRLLHSSRNRADVARGGRGRDGCESPEVMLSRVLRGLPDRVPICVLNDEAHHCYLPEKGRRSGAAGTEDDKTAALWFNAIRALHETGRLGRVHDFSATPMFIDTTAKRKSVMFPWVVSDFPLMDAIEAGLVKIPRVPVDDDTHDREVVWRNLYKHTEPKTVQPHAVPPTLGSALDALYRHYEDTFKSWRNNGLPTPPVFIVVANTIANAQALYMHMAGWSEEQPSGGMQHYAGTCELFSNIRADGTGPADHVRTLLVHSKIENSDGISKSSRLGQVFKSQANRLRAAATAVDAARTDHSSDDKEIIREALNTVGRPGGLGERIRCVVSVSMLTEGWDTRTVTHVLGFRAFSTQLLCEQVTGRALRRSNYDSFDEQGRLTPEFADVLGVPFDFMPVSGADEPVPPKHRYEVFTMSGRGDRRVEWPALTGYLVEPLGRGVHLDPDCVQPHVVVPQVPTMAETAGVAGESDMIATGPDRDARRQSAVMNLAARVTAKLEESLADTETAEVPAVAGSDTAVDMEARTDLEEYNRPSRAETEARADPEAVRSVVFSTRRRRLFVDAVAAVREWLVQPNVKCDEIGWLMHRDLSDAAASAVTQACIARAAEAGRIVGCFDVPPVRTTAGVHFETSLTDRYPQNEAETTRRCELNAAACHSDFERQVAAVLDARPEVHAWVRNFRLDWSVPYNFRGVRHHYTPDFIVRLFGPQHSSEAVHLIVECKGAFDELSRAKADYVREWWIPAVRKSPQTPPWLRLWHFVELSSSEDFRIDLDRAFEQAKTSVQTEPKCPIHRSRL